MVMPGNFSLPRWVLLGVSTEARHEREVEAEVVNEPLQAGAALVDESVGELLVRRAAADGVGHEDLRAVVDALRALRTRARSVHARRGLGGVPAEERTLVNHEDFPSVLKHGVRGAEAAQTTADNDRARHEQGPN